jgi:hypothetical protein
MMIDIVYLEAGLKLSRSYYTATYTYGSLLTIPDGRFCTPAPVFADWTCDIHSSNIMLLVKPSSDLP